MDLALVIGLVGAWLVVVLLAVVVYQLFLQNGRMLLRLEDLEAEIAGAPGYSPVAAYVPFLPKGSAAPAFVLPDLNGNSRTLSEWRGRRVLLVFVEPNCSFSRTLVPYIAALADDVVEGRPSPVVVSTGAPEENRALFDEAGFSGPVLLQERREVATAYRVDGTPMSYLVEPDGTIGSELASGVQATMILAGDIARVSDATESQGPVRIETGMTPRDALPPGETAPVFRLPRLEGGELSLLEYRGRQVVIVFSDPNCEPCDKAAAWLDTHYRSHPELPIVMISRGGAEANNAKVEELGLGFPVVLQRHWEISREYGIFATPIAFLVDEWGVIATDVAVGPEAIRALVEQAMESQPAAFRP